MTPRGSAQLAIEAVMIFWQQARIPTQFIARCIDELLKIYDKWKTVLKNSTRKSDAQTQREEEFIGILDDLFDIATANALNEIRIEEDKQFLLRQRQRGRPGCMIGVDDWPQLSTMRKFQMEWLFTFSLRGLPVSVCDWIPPRLNLHRRFNTFVSSIWSSATEPFPLSSFCWFTDGSKTDQLSGAGVYNEALEAFHSFNLGEDSSVFQAEVFAISRCAELAMTSDLNHTVICSDSQAAIKALIAAQVSSAFVEECIGRLNALAEQGRVTLVWVPGHTGIHGNERADELARAGAATPSTSPRPILPIPLTFFRSLWKKRGGAVHSRGMGLW